MLAFLSGLFVEYWDESVLFLLPLVFGAGFYQTRKGAWVHQMIQALAGVAVEKQEIATVIPYKEENRVAKLPVSAQKAAKGNAVTDVITALTPVLGPAAERLGPAAADAIEAVIARLHNVLPDPSRDRFDRFRLVIVFLALGLMLGACTTLSLPTGWNESDAGNLDAVAAACGASVYGASVEDEIGRALRNVGNVGAEAFLAAVKVGDNEEYQLQAAATAMENYAGFAYAGVFEGRTLGAVIRGVTGVAANDADQVLGLLWAGLAAKAELSALELRVFHPGRLVVATVAG